MKIWPFNRNKKDQSVYPQEVQNYYQSESRERKGIAGLLAIGTLVGTILLATALFFGGRWVYRTIFDSNSDTTTEQTQNGQVGEDGASDDSRTDSSEESTPPLLPGNETTEDGSPTDTPTPTPSPQTETNLPNSGELPRTGPSEDN